MLITLAIIALISLITGKSLIKRHKHNEEKKNK